LQAINIVLEDRSGRITISATYSYVFETRFINKSYCHIWIHTVPHNWGSRLILSKERELLKTIEVVNLATLCIGEPIYWPFDDKKTSDLLDFGIIKDISKDYCRTQSCLELSSDYSPVIFIINSKIMTRNKLCTLYNIKTEWS